MPVCHRLAWKNGPDQSIGIEIKSDQDLRSSVILGLPPCKIQLVENYYQPPLAWVERLTYFPAHESTVKLWLCEKETTSHSHKAVFRSLHEWPMGPM